MNVQNEDFHQSFIDKAVILPPESKPDFEVYKRFTRVVIDSKDRDTDLFPNTNAYEITLDDDIEDVLQVQLLNIDIPLSTYLVNNHFRTFLVSTSNAIQYTEVTLDIGNYSDTELAIELEKALNTAFSGDTFRVEYVKKTDNFLIKSTHQFSVQFQNALALLLGFQESVIYMSQSTGVAPWTNTIQSPNRSNFKYNNYAVMTIDQFDINKSNNNTLNKSFAIIMNNYSSMNISDDPQIVKRFSPPLSRLTKLRIKFYDRFGNPYDFNGLDHRFELLFESFKQKRKYQNIFFNR